MRGVLAFGLCLLVLPSTVTQAPTAPLARLYIYTTPDVRPRHREVVRLAIEKRAKTHTSGFAANGNEPRLALGPVQKNVWHWRWDRRKGEWDKNTSATRAWPFIAVLEYTGVGKPEAYIDWFRRPKNNRDVGGWSKDPADQRYARHISDQTVCHRDDRYAYMALCDTVTGDVIPNNEWLIRARVDWQEPEHQLRTGWWLRFHDTHKKIEHWHADLLPLVSWVPESTRGKKGDFARTNGVALADSQLCVFGTRTVFELPRIPDSVVPCRGF